MQISVSGEFQDFVQSKVRSGDYDSPDQVVAEALARLRAEEIDPAELARLVAKGQAAADRGELIDSEDVFEEIRRESERRQGKPA